MELRRMQSMVKAVLFDLDGLLVNTEYTWYQVWNDMLGEFGHSFTLEEYVKGYSGRNIIDNVNSLIEHYDLPITLETGKQMAIDTEKGYIEKGVDLKPGAKELLAFLKENGYKIILATSSALDRALTILKSNQVDGYFDDIVTGYDVERSKPFPDVFLAAAKKAGCQPEECLVLEDSGAGIKAAYAAGIPVICIPDLKQPEQEHVEMTAAVMESLFEVIGYLER